MEKRFCGLLYELNNNTNNSNKPKTTIHRKNHPHQCQYLSAQKASSIVVSSDIYNN